MNAEAFSHALAYGLVFLLVFLLLRAFVLWYWKIGEGLKKLDRIIALLEKIAGQPKP